MLDRADILKLFSLPDRSAFEMEPHRDAQGVWRIKVSHEGDRAVHMSQGHVTRLADMIRSLDRHLADQIDACVEKARRHSKNSN